MPTLIQNYQKQVWVNQLKKSYSMWNQAFQKILADEGVERLSDTELFGKMPSNLCGNTTQQLDKNPECREFFKGLQKYIDFELPTQQEDVYVGVNSTTGKRNKIPAYPLKMKDGSMVGPGSFRKGAQRHTFWDDDGNRADACPYIKAAGGHMCSYIATFSFFDVNGKKGPNQIGRDIFQFYVSDEGMLFPYGGKDYAIFQDIDLRSGENFGTVDSNYDGSGNMKDHWKNTSSYNSGCVNGKLNVKCTGRIMEEGWKMNY